MLSQPSPTLLFLRQCTWGSQMGSAAATAKCVCYNECPEAGSADAGDVKLYGSADAGCAGDLVDRRSTTGYSFHLQKAGAANCWSIKKQPTAAISTSEAEYQAIAAAVQEALWAEMGVVVDGPTVIKEDNQICIKMCKNPVMQKRSKQSMRKLYLFENEWKMRQLNSNIAQL